MDKKAFAKRYLISVFALIFAGAAVLFILLFFIGRRFGGNLSAAELASVTLCASLLPAGSFTGFIDIGSRISEIKTKQAIILIVLFPLVLPLVTAYGIVMIIPSVIKSLLYLLRG